MPPGDEASPTPSSIPSAAPKRPRPSAAGTASGPSRTKRRKADENADAEENGAGKGKQPVNFGVGMVKGREDEWGEPADVVTKIDFNTLPDEALYKYLEYHDLLPRWTASPWSEDPCTPPNALYTLASQPAPIPIVPESGTRSTNEADPEPEPPAAAPAPPVEPKPTEDTPLAEGAETRTKETEGDKEGKEDQEGKDAEGDQPMGEEGDEDGPAPPTTRSKTAPHRKMPTPPPGSPTPTPEVKRGVITLSDVHAARAALAEKANAHWMKGLGGGQNKEGETIVNFLYKMKVGPGRLLRVYNPFPPPTEY